MSPEDDKHVQRLAYHAALLTLIQHTEKYAQLVDHVGKAAQAMDPDGREAARPEEEAAIRAVSEILREATRRNPGMASVFTFAADNHIITLPR